MVGTGYPIAQAIAGAGARLSDAGSNLAIGRKYGAADRFDGVLDELRISNVVRSPDWIRVEYKSATDSFVTYGAEELVDCLGP